jgi:hypothetical protein
MEEFCVAFINQTTKYKHKSVCIIKQHTVCVCVCVCVCVYVVVLKQSNKLMPLVTETFRTYNKQVIYIG